MALAPLTVARHQVLEHLKQIGLVWDTASPGRSPSETLTPRALGYGNETLRNHLTLVSAPETADSRTLPVLRVAGLDGEAPSAGTAAELEVEHLLGEGGMGRVHSARQRSLDRSVAIKTLLTPSDASSAALLTEGRVTGALEHPGIVPVHALGLTPGGHPVLVMKRVEGKTLREVLRAAFRDGTAGERLIDHLQILMAVCNAVQFAHTRGILHRDIKPSNVMLGAYGEVYLVDWGIALRLGEAPERPQPGVETLRMIGTPSYMAPEMAQTGVLDARTDVYLLGSTLHEILTGQARHAGESILEVVWSAIESTPPEYDASVPEELAAIVRRATHVDPAERHPSALELRDDLAVYVRLHTVLALVHTAEERLTRSTLLDVADPKRRTARRDTLLECRFGFAQALREAPHHVAARRGMRECVLSLAELELAEDNVDAARALLVEVEDPPPDLLGRLEAATHERDRLRQVAAELDLSAAARHRRMIVLVAGAALLAANVWTLLVRTPAHPGLVATAALNFVLAIALPQLSRRSLDSAVNRRIRATWASTATMFLFGRVVGMLADIPPASVIAMEQIAVGGVVAVFAAAWLPSLWIASGLLAAGGFVAALAPAIAGPTFLVTSTLGMVASAVARGRRLAPPGVPTPGVTPGGHGVQERNGTCALSAPP